MIDTDESCYNCGRPIFASDRTGVMMYYHRSSHSAWCNNHDNDTRFATPDGSEYR